MENYELVIGLEVHIELMTDTKIFCGCSTRFGGKVNSQICPVCMGMPGTYPVLNKKVVEHSVKVATALNCKINKNFRFDRKNYFYPDNPQNYQISQFHVPIGVDGYVDIANGCKRIRIHEMHMEEDAGKLIHTENETWIDYNRAGVPLIEIVTEHDMSDADEVIEFLETLRGYMRYLGVSDCKLNEGSMRVDVNLSVRKPGKELGTRTEMKNINSFKATKRAINEEAKRQIELIESGKTVEMETRRWDDIKGCSYLMRKKESINDYRYFADPDLLEYVIEDSYINEIRQHLPEFEKEKKDRYVKMYKIPEYDAGILSKEVITANLFEGCCSVYNEPKKISNWIMCELLRVIKEKHEDIDNIQVTPNNLTKLLIMLNEGKITRVQAREISDVVYKGGIDPEIYAKENHLSIQKDNQMILNVLNEIINDNPQAVDDIANGIQKARGYLIGQAMKKLKGQADAKATGNMLDELLKSHITSDNNVKNN